MTDRWYYAKGGQRFGPFAFEQIGQLAASGLLSAGDMVSNEEGRSWVSAGTVPGLAFPPPSPSPGPAAAVARQPPKPDVGNPAAVPATTTRSKTWTALVLGALLGFFLVAFKDLFALRSAILDLGVCLGGLACLVTGSRALLTGVVQGFDGRPVRKLILYRLGGLFALVLGLSWFLFGWNEIMTPSDRSSDPDTAKPSRLARPEGPSGEVPGQPPSPSRTTVPF